MVPERVLHSAIQLPPSCRRRLCPAGLPRQRDRPVVLQAGAGPEHRLKARRHTTGAA